MENFTDADGKNMEIQPTSKSGRKIINSQLSTEGLKSRAHSYSVQTNAYVLNKVVALKKKLSQCGNEHLIYQMKPNKNFVMKLSPSAYELAKLVVVEHLFKDDFFKDYFIASCIKEDEYQNQVGSLFRVFNKKKDGSQGLQLKFSVNFYHTTSSILVNGNRVELFENELFKPICEAIKASCLSLSVMNEQIAQVLSSTEKVEAVGTVRAIDNIVPDNADTENLPELLTQDGTENSQDDPTAHDIIYDNSNINSTLCPSCEQTAGDQTIACEECGEWYHFSCTGLGNPICCAFHLFIV